MAKLVVVFSGIPGYQARSTQVLAENMVPALRRLGMHLLECPLRAPPLFRFVRPRFLAEFVLRYLMYPWLAFRIWRRLGNAPVYWLTDHASAFLVCFIPRPARVVVQVNDLCSILPANELPYPPTWKQRLIHLLAILFKNRGIRRADHLSTISIAVKQQIVQHFGVPQDHVTVVYCGVDIRVFKPRHQCEARRSIRLSPRRRYLMTVAPASTRKNIPCLLQAFHQLSSRYSDLPLLYVGEMDVHSKKLVKRLKLQERILRFEDVPAETLAALYQSADIYVFPSFYEGFGLPALEAMASGCPVIVSDIPSLKEVVGAAALSFPPEQPEPLARAIARFLDDPLLARDRATAGLMRAGLFSWNQTARRMQTVLTRTPSRRASSDASSPLPPFPCGTETATAITSSLEVPESWSAELTPERCPR